MFKKFDDLLDQLESLSVDFELFNDTFTAIVEGFEFGANEIPKNALCLPNMMLNDMTNKLTSITDRMQSVAREALVNRNA